MLPPISAVKVASDGAVAINGAAVPATANTLDGFSIASDGTLYVVWQ